MIPKVWAFVAIMGVLSAPQALAQGKGLPAVLASGVQAYKANGAGAGVKAWLSGSPTLQNSDLVAKTTASLKGVEAAYGPFLDLEVLQTSPLGSHVQRHYVVLLYQKGPLFAHFDAYSSAGRWIVTGFLFDTKPDTIVPAELFGVFP